VPACAMTPDEIVADLKKLPLHSIDEARAAAPEDSGFYAWWCRIDALPNGVPTVPHPDTDHSLLYIGIAPNSATSHGNLRKRLKQHSKGAIGSSTFRRGLTALLWEVEGWQPIWATTRPGLENVHLDALSTWQKKFLQVQWCEVEEPWTTEPMVVAALRPPTNIDHNDHHEFRPTMSAARRCFRQAAESIRDLEV
jgi:hypothetical protein